MAINKDCIFCKIVNKEIPTKIIAENNLALAFLDVSPISDGHTLVIPKNHHLDMGTCFKLDLKAVWDLAQDAGRLIEESKLKPWGFNYLSNQGSIAGQEVNHFHVHVIPKYQKNSGFKFGKENVDVQDVQDVYDLIERKIKKSTKKVPVLE